MCNIDIYFVCYFMEIRIQWVLYNFQSREREINNINYNIIHLYTTSVCLLMRFHCILSKRCCLFLNENYLTLNFIFGQVFILF